MTKLSIIIPVHNEEKTIEQVIKDIKKYLFDYNYEIIIINDGSTDQTKAVLQKMNNIMIINHSFKLGYGAAIKSGVKQSSGEYFLIIDGDATYPAESIPLLIKETDYDMVVGARIGLRTDIPILRKPAKYCINKISNYLTETKIPDLNSGLRLIKKSSFNKFIHLFPDGFSLTTTITLAFLTNNYKIKYIPINYYKRKGKSKIRPIKDTLNFLQLIIRTIIYFNPLKIFIPVGLFLLLSAFLIFIYSYFIIQQIMDITIIILIMSSIQILAIGVLADLIVKSIKR